MIYVTRFNPVTKLAISRSIDSGFTDITQVIVALGCDFKTVSNRIVVYNDVAYSDFPIYIDTIDNNTGLS